jgi:hypothetical protein
MSAVWAHRDAARVPPGLRGGTHGDDRQVLPPVVECHLGSASGNGSAHLSYSGSGTLTNNTTNSAG